jgi:hypothetical protein
MSAALCSRVRRSRFKELFQQDNALSFVRQIRGRMRSDPFEEHLEFFFPLFDTGVRHATLHALPNRKARARFPPHTTLSALKRKYRASRRAVVQRYERPQLWREP